MAIGFKVDKVSPEFGGEEALRARATRFNPASNWGNAGDAPGSAGDDGSGTPVIYFGSERAIRRLEAGEGHHFKIYCGEGLFVCSGKSLDNDSEDAFAPLDYYAEGEFGAVEIRYRNAKGAYEVL